MLVGVSVRQGSDWRDKCSRDMKTKTINVTRSPCCSSNRYTFSEKQISFFSMKTFFSVCQNRLLFFNTEECLTAAMLNEDHKNTLLKDYKAEHADRS